MKCCICKKRTDPINAIHSFRDKDGESHLYAEGSIIEWAKHVEEVLICSGKCYDDYLLREKIDRMVV